MVGNWLYLRKYKGFRERSLRETTKNIVKKTTKNIFYYIDILINSV